MGTVYPTLDASPDPARPWHVVAPGNEEMPMIIDAGEQRARTCLQAMATVVSAGGAPPSPMDERALAGAWEIVFGLDDPPPFDSLEPIDPDDLARALDDPVLRLTAVRLMAIMAFVDGIVEDPKLIAVLEAAAALDVDTRFVRALTHMHANDVHWAGIDMVQANVESIPGMPWDPDDPMSGFLPYRDGNARPDLVERYEALATLPAGSLGREFYDHYHDNGFAFPGSEWGVAAEWGTPHDTLHLISGYSTSAQGELLVAVFNGASLSHPDDMFESHVLPVVLTYHLGIEINKGINKGDRERMDSDPSWRDNFDGNVHLGLDPVKLWTAWSRGAAMTEDLFSGMWDFWAHVRTPLAELRAAYGVDELPVAQAALDDDEIDPSGYARPGYPLPEISRTSVAERPAG